MSKLNRKQFKDLLLEWKQNFINERVSQSLSSHIKSKHDFVVVQIEEKNPNFLKKLVEAEISYSILGQVVKLLVCNKEEKLEEVLRSFEKDNENKALLELYYNQSYPILVASGTSGDLFSEENVNSKEECLDWCIHDLYHTIFDRGYRGQSEFLDVDYKAEELIKKYKDELFTDLNYDFEEFAMDNLMDYDEEYSKYLISYHKQNNKEDEELRKVKDIVKSKEPKKVIAEIVDYFQRINFTYGIESDDLIASIFSYCLIKMPDPDDIQGLKELFRTSNLSDEAKIYLLVSNDISKRNFKNIVLPEFKDKVLFIDLSISN
tara:strand:- start:20604 stop:21560 length:957 start_codon:yes stop_codon:yes gene_type:complete